MGPDITSILSFSPPKISVIFTSMLCTLGLIYFNNDIINNSFYLTHSFPLEYKFQIDFNLYLFGFRILKRHMN